MSVLDRELQALDDDDHGLLYALGSQGHACKEYCYALFPVHPRPLTVRQSHDSLYLLGNDGLEATPLGSSPSVPGAYAADEQAEYLVGPAEYWEFATDAEARPITPADLVDANSGFESQQFDVNETMMAPELALVLEDVPSYLDEDSVETSALPPVLEPSPYHHHDVYMSDYETVLEHSDTIATGSRPRTATSWLSATEEVPVPDSSSAIASASEVSTGLVPSFAQGRDLLLGLSESSGRRRNPYSMTSIEEDVAKNLRGHWLPQRF